ncbi:helix-turn-helix transcriptional regulator [Auritidibacter ignavus]|uniref:helix-turn-helix domain-containing protein n=1 Tax=Auritidibacter ignavus TaxID=678932 RepID=UPI002449512F|nr:helix-turn-helix transcriptional regulator [Auritidibacter ignavus]WGH91436.1 helix-turn-helix transcriptional regulator [Auritidibacter ignavus]
MNINTERAIAKKIQQLRLTRGWTYQALADRMKEAGHHIDPSGIHKTEKAGRRITVNELIGYTRAFDIRVTQLLGEPETPQEIAKQPPPHKQPQPQPASKPSQTNSNTSPKPSTTSHNKSKTTVDSHTVAKIKRTR